MLEVEAAPVVEPVGGEEEITRSSRVGDRKKAAVAPPPDGAFVNEGAEIEPDEDWC